MENFGIKVKKNRCFKNLIVSASFPGGELNLGLMQIAYSCGDHSSQNRHCRSSVTFRRSGKRGIRKLRKIYLLNSSIRDLSHLREEKSRTCFSKYLNKKRMS
ncbi:unnamed protein product, partial [Vitis vinifera]